MEKFNAVINEYHAEEYIRNENASIRTESTLDTRQLLSIGDKVFTEENNRLRTDFHRLIEERVATEIDSRVSYNEMRLVP